MAAANKPTEDGRGAASDFTIIIGTVLSVSFADLGSVPQHEAILVGFAIACLIGYFIPPRPSMGFVRWMLERLIFLTCFYVAVLKVPLLLKRSLTTPFAYGVPVLIFVLGFIVWLRHARNSSLERA